jgi:hypothetical protein
MVGPCGSELQLESTDEVAVRQLKVRGEGSSIEESPCMTLYTVQICLMTWSPIGMGTWSRQGLNELQPAVFPEGLGHKGTHSEDLLSDGVFRHWAEGWIGRDCGRKAYKAGHKVGTGRIAGERAAFLLCGFKITSTPKVRLGSETI